MAVEIAGKCEFILARDSLPGGLGINIQSGKGALVLDFVLRNVAFGERRHYIGHVRKDQCHEVC